MIPNIQNQKLMHLFVRNIGKMMYMNITELSMISVNLHKLFLEEIHQSGYSNYTIYLIITDSTI